ncbi:hypothetical protein [Bradyrhizobium sp. BR 1432]|uniref:hypothetical protein n=1 Tax=Bradyrhizobium sp. BR 1432 TaxID=3447966 RepID=UPI003EE66D4A
MMFWTDLDAAYDEVHNARAAVEKAEVNYSRGGGTVALNVANKRLADAYADLRAINGGRVRDLR